MNYFVAVLTSLAVMCPLKGQALGDLAAVTRNTGEAIERIKAAADEPRIKSRFSDLKCASEIEVVSKAYGYGPFAVQAVVKFEMATIKLSQSGVLLVEGSWLDYPEKLVLEHLPPQPLPAHIHGEDLLTKLLRLSVFVPEDLTELARSRIPEVRAAAVANLNNRTLLAKMSVADPSYEVRAAAAGRLDDFDAPAKRTALEQMTDQASLASVAMEDEDPFRRKYALGNLTDQAMLAKVAIGGKDFSICKLSLQKITDQALLAKVAAEGGHDHGWRASFNERDVSGQPGIDEIAFAEITDEKLVAAVVVKLTNQQLLARIATQHPDSRVRLAAVNRLIDPAKLAKIAKEDRDESVRKAAASRLPRR